VRQFKNLFEIEYFGITLMASAWNGEHKFPKREVVFLSMFPTR